MNATRGCFAGLPGPQPFFLAPSLPQIFKGSFGNARPWKKQVTNPYLVPPQPEEIPIPYPPRPAQPQLPPAAAAAMAIL